MTASASATVPARVHLAGNPSDGYGGAVLSAAVPQLSAEVWVEESDRFSVSGPRQEWATLADLEADTARTGHDNGDRLVSAALVTLHRCLPAAVARRPGRFRWSTSVPRSVGLAGSSAVVIATMRAALEWWDATDAVTTMDLARAALRAETDELGIAAGLADRTVQAMGATVLTDCRTAPGTARHVTVPRPVELTLAWNVDAAQPSDHYHRDLRRRFDAGDAGLVSSMTSLADLAEQAADALERGEIERFTAALDASLVARRAFGPVPEAAVAPVDELREAGSRVNFAGSGGSLVLTGPATLPDGWSCLPVMVS